MFCQFSCHACHAFISFEFHSTEKAETLTMLLSSFPFILCILPSICNMTRPDHV